MTGTIRAPWTPEQVDDLNRFQREGGMHPFTCGNEHPAHPNAVLAATVNGWRCFVTGCDWEQDWAHAFMANPDAWPKPSADRPGVYCLEAPEAATPETEPNTSTVEQLLDAARADVVHRVQQLLTPAPADEALREQYATVIGHWWDADYYACVRRAARAQAAARYSIRHALHRTAGHLRRLLPGSTP